MLMKHESPSYTLGRYTGCAPNTVMGIGEGASTTSVPPSKIVVLSISRGRQRADNRLRAFRRPLHRGSLRKRSRCDLGTGLDKTRASPSRTGPYKTPKGFSRAIIIPNSAHVVNRLGDKRQVRHEAVFLTVAPSPVAQRLSEPHKLLDGRGRGIAPHAV